MGSNSLTGQKQIPRLVLMLLNVSWVTSLIRCQKSGVVNAICRIRKFRNIAPPIVVPKKDTVVATEVKGLKTALIFSTKRKEKCHHNNLKDVNTYKFYRVSLKLLKLKSLIITYNNWHEQRRHCKSV